MFKTMFYFEAYKTKHNCNYANIMKPTLTKVLHLGSKFQT